MESYKKLTRDLIEQEIGEYMTWNDGATRADAMKYMADNGFENLFGNIDGSRTYNTYAAQKFLEESGALFDDDIRDLFNDISDTYFAETLARGAETLDVVICELVGQRELYEMASAEGVEL